jgi:hypothetical protein
MESAWNELAYELSIEQANSRAWMKSVVLIQVKDALFVKMTDSLIDKIIDQIGVGLVLLHLRLHILHLLLHLLDTGKLFGDFMFPGNLLGFDILKLTSSSLPFRSHFQETCASGRFSN